MLVLLRRIRFGEKNNEDNVDMLRLRSVTCKQRYMVGSSTLYTHRERRIQVRDVGRDTELGAIPVLLRNTNIKDITGHITKSSFNGLVENSARWQ